MTTTTTQPVPPNAQILADIDATLIGLLAMAYFGPAEQCTAKSVDQVTAAEVLLFRLRSARKAVAELREALDLPARQNSIQGHGPGGLGPNLRLIPGEELTPSSAAAALVGHAARESQRPDTPEAGADVPDGSDIEGCRPGRNGRAVGAVGAATFASPNTRVPLRFADGEHRLVGSALFDNP